MIPFQNPDIFIGSLRIQEPITALTDLLIVTVCVFAFIKTTATKNVGVNLYRWFFLATGISTFISAIIGHAFLYQLDINAKIYGWVTGIISIGVGQYAALYHTRAVIGEKNFNILRWLNSIEILLALIFVFVVFSFGVVEVHSAIGLLLSITVLEYINYKHNQSVLSKYMMIGIAVAALAVICHMLKLAISIWFNHLDLSHVIIAISVYFMYKGVSIYQTNTSKNTN